MAHTGLFATSAEIIARLGDNYPSTLFIEARINEACLQAESFINAATKYNWSDKFTAPATTTLSVDVWYLLSEVESCLVAIAGLTLKPGGEDGAMVRIEFEDRINILRDTVLRDLSILRDKPTQHFMLGET